MTRLVKPNHYEGVDEQRHRRGARDGLGKTIGRVLQAQELLAIFKGAFTFPPHPVESSRQFRRQSLGVQDVGDQPYVVLALPGRHSDHPYWQRWLALHR